MPDRSPPADFPEALTFSAAATNVPRLRLKTRR